MIDFPIKYCPLCSEKLIVDDQYGHIVYDCPTKWDPAFSGEKEPLATHYKVIKYCAKATQHIYIYPFTIDTNSDDNMSRVYKILENEDYEFILEFQAIKNYNPENIVERIKNLMVFI